MTKIWNDFKVLVIVFAIFFGVAYLAIKFDQWMGWEHARALKHLTGEKHEL